jgi:heme exporter protein C
MAWTWFHRLGSPPYAYGLAKRLTPWFAWTAGIVLVAGLFDGLVLSPPDYQQGDGYRIIYVHAATATLSLTVYTVMALAAAVAHVWHIKVANAVAASCAPIGLSFTIVGLATGMLWGKPMWGTYWVWDPKLVSMLLMVFLYLGYMGLRASFDDIARADRVSGMLAIVGVVNVPIVYFSVYWWNSLHQAPSVFKLGKPTMATSMLMPFLAVWLGFNLFFAAVVLVRLRGELLRRERSASWVQQALAD